MNINEAVRAAMIDRLHASRPMKVYLCGAIDNAKDGGVGWRRELGDRLRGHTVLDPTAKPTQSLAVTAKTALAAGDVATARKCMATVRDDDLAMLAACDWVLAYIDPEQRPCGSYFELAYARALGKSVYVVAPNPPLWLLAEFPVQKSFDSWFA